jgi:hypothetical protein
MPGGAGSPGNRVPIRETRKPMPRRPGKASRADRRSPKPGLTQAALAPPRKRRYHTRAKDGILYIKKRFSSRFIEKAIYSGAAAEKLILGKKRTK